MSEPATEPATVPAADQRWPWWPLLPLYPYGRRRTLVRELVAGRLWSFEQLQGVWYVAVPIRMLVLRVREGLLLYAPVPPTAEVRARLRGLEERHGRVCTIVLPTASGLEHKLPVPAMARAFPDAQVWVAPKQWSFPLPLPPAWLGFPARRTRELLSDGVPHGDQLDWLPLGPLDLGLGTFLEIACFDRASGSLLLTDALVAIPPEPPAVFDLDPTPLLFHARERGDEPLRDDPQQRRRGWWRLVLFATYLRPRPLVIPPLGELLRHCLAPGCRDARAHFGFYPFRWQPGWQADFEALAPGGRSSLQVAAVLERLVFPRQRAALVAWIRVLAGLKGLRRVVPAHHDAPVASSAEELAALADRIETGDWAPDQGAWETLAGIDRTLVGLGLVPGEGDG
ncbi:DUF4336 domain-containing protein [Aphanothece minutissima]|uniref:DUF4336 domain-containing protein n=1 Tax=Aphanothece cf. minutissima CCALA 015 TaxID=2107695 RepID=A0ABX5FCL4_9CHRO|nr:DUF4336 domain-containing protein [Aphanothece minutissima]PSB38568.1 hypothetical protein C7B81_03085 [Aphanothece cf. minutissima CCALA 015]